VVFVNEGNTGGQIDTLIERLATRLNDAGAEVHRISDENELFDLCPSTLTGLSPCYGAVSFESSPTEGGVWAYTARADFGLGLSPYVNSADNDAQIFVLPFVHAIDAEIAAIEGVPFPQEQYEYPFTYETRQDRADDIQRFFMRALYNYLAVAMFIGICGICYHMPGHIATERELGISSLVDSMLFTSHQTYAMLARLISVYLSFVAVYMPSWLAMGAIVATLIFEQTPASIIVPFHLLTGLSLTGYSIFMASLFRKAQLSGTATLLLALILAILSQFIPRTEIIQGVLGCLFPPATYTFFQIEIAYMEGLLQPYRLRNPYSWRAGLDGYCYFIFLAVQIVLYPLLACLVQWSMYSTPARCRKPLTTTDGSALRIVHFTKVFQPTLWRRIFGRSKPFKAVDDLNLSLSRGHVVALLGANGSGKSTTLAAIAGTQSTSQGHIERDPSLALGFCPQKNVLWDELSVLEHVRIFNALKAKDKRQTETELRDLIIACDLGKKIGKKSKTLSGGQKRKLQLAMAFVGHSQVCCVDEVSSGLDPLSRRKIWNILLSERERRTLFLTTHALDEADALADDIVIMSKGRLVVQGSAPELKHVHGGGYHVVTSDPQAMHIPSLQPQIDISGDYSFNSPTSAGARSIAKEARLHGVKDLQIHGPTIQDVFLSLSKEFADESSQMPSLAILDDRSSSQSHDATTSPSLQGKTNGNVLGIESGRGSSFIQQTWILYRKRLLILRRNWLPYVFLLVIPVVASGLTTMFLAGFNPLQCTRGALANRPQVLSLGSLERYWGILVPVGPLTQIPIDALPAPYQLYADRIRPVESYAEFRSYVSDNFRDVVPGGFYVGEDIGPNPAPLMAYRINGNIGYAALAKNILDSYLTGITINAEFSNFALPFVGGTGDSLQLVLYITFAMCAYTAFFALYPTFERLSNIRALHYSNGVRPAPLWLAYWLFDAFFAIIVAVVSVALLATVALPSSNAFRFIC
jgi:ABC-type multidrug transport system ATPase subunit